MRRRLTRVESCGVESSRPITSRRVESGRIRICTRQRALLRFSNAKSTQFDRLLFARSKEFIINKFKIFFWSILKSIFFTHFFFLFSFLPLYNQCLLSAFILNEIHLYIYIYTLSKYYPLRYLIASFLNVTQRKSQLLETRTHIRRETRISFSVNSIPEKTNGL